MDHRCLYGHRVPKDFAFAIQNRQCPMCGAPSVTIVGYQLARQLTEKLEMEAIVAFNTMRIIEEGYSLVPIGPDQADTTPAMQVDEIEVPAEDLEADDEDIAEDVELSDGEDAEEPAAAADKDTAGDNGTIEDPTEVPADFVARVQVPDVDPTALPRTANRPNGAITDETADPETDFGEIENDFFGTADA